MAPNLCTLCREMSLKIFREENDGQGRTGGPELRLPPFNVMKRNAGLGCHLCKIITAQAIISEIPWPCLEHQSIRVRRALIGPKQAVTAYISQTDIFTRYFTRIPSQWMGSYPLRGYNDPDCELHLMRTWLSHCQDDHPNCQVQKPLIGPRRLLDVCPESLQKDIRLIVRYKDENWRSTQFVCLSHCWGSLVSPKRTTKATLDAHKERIAFDELSQTFKDAVCITRDLGYRYLWIDSLCIVQDDEDDWLEEAQNMPDIYGASILTIAALDSSDGSGGCRTGANREEQRKIWRRVDVVNEGDGVRFFESKPTYWCREYGDNPYKHETFGPNPLRTRAWTLQERELPVRSIHFSKRMLLWQCRTMKGSSELPWSEIDPMDDFPALPLQNEPGEDLQGESLLLRYGWFDIVEDYTTRFMSVESDKLPAILGLATRYGRALEDKQYVSGIFLAHMPSALLWRVKSRDPGEHDNVFSAFQPRRPMHARAPSWSWAALDGAITYDSQRLVDHLGPLSAQSYARSDFRLQFETVPTTFLPGVDLAPVEVMALSVNGRVLSLQLERTRRGSRIPLAGESIFLVDAVGKLAGVFYPDIPLEIQSVGVVMCLEVRREPYFSEVIPPESLELFRSQLNSEEEFDRYPRVMGLALVPIAEGERVYKRLGLVRWVLKSLFHDTGTARISIV